MMNRLTCFVHAVQLLAFFPSALGVTTYSYCYEGPGSNDQTKDAVEATVTAFNAMVSDPQLVAVDKTNFAGVHAGLKDGSCHLAEADAGKAYGFSLDPNVLAFPIAIEGSGSYKTMAVAKKAKLDADGITTFCDVITNGSYKASHTGFMKSAGWISPMGATMSCVASVGTDTQKGACDDLTQTGAGCHDAVFGDSCVPDILKADGTAETTGVKICNACTLNSCADDTYGNYYGAAKCLLDDNCDIAFVKEATMECPTDGVGYCKTEGAGNTQADCLKANPTNCDSKSVYAKGYTVTADTYVRVKGYGVDVPAHVVVGRGMTDDFKTIVGAKLAGSSYTAGTNGSGAWFHGHGKSLTDKTSVASVVDVIGTGFTAIMRDIPYFYEKNGLTRPSDQTRSSFFEISGANSVAGPAATVVAILISGMAFLASHF